MGTRSRTALGLMGAVLACGAVSAAPAKAAGGQTVVYTYSGSSAHSSGSYIWGPQWTVYVSQKCAKGAHLEGHWNGPDTAHSFTLTSPAKTTWSGSFSHTWKAKMRYSITPVGGKCSYTFKVTEYEQNHPN